MWATNYEYLAEALKEETPILLTSSEEGSVFHYEKLNVVVKQRYPNPDIKHQVQWEFDVGMLINAYNSPYMVKTLGFYIQESNACIVTEYVPGFSLLELSQEHHNATLYLQLLYTLRTVQEQMEFTHYDLHNGNVIVEVTSVEEKVFPQTTIISPYKITFIDFGRSHVDGVKDGYYETTIIDAVSCPGIFDPLFDYGSYVCILNRVICMRENLVYPIFIRDEQIKKLLEDNNFMTNEFMIFDVIGYPFGSMYKGKLFKNHKAWASTIGYPVLIQDFTGNDYVALGQSCVYEKLLDMQNKRFITSEAFFRACVDYIQRSFA